MPDSANNLSTTPAGAQAPVGVFDSGLGGLSVLRHIHALLPAENLIYFADSGNAPYGGKTEAQVAQRARAVAGFLLSQGVKAMVVACNTATAAAIDGIRAQIPDLPVVGVEPGLKPGAGHTRTGKVGVLATEGTLASQRFLQLRDQLTAQTQAQFLLMPCPGLADQVEKGALRARATKELVRKYVQPLLAQGADVLVLGCTHYPFLLPLIESVAQECADDQVTIVDTGEAVARQLQRVLEQRGLLSNSAGTGVIEGFTTGSASSLSRSLAQLLDLDISAKPLQNT